MSADSFAARLDRAIARSGVKLIEAKVGEPSLPEYLTSHFRMASKRAIDRQAQGGRGVTTPYFPEPPDRLDLIGKIVLPTLASPPL
jgi:hypothetical protein